MSGHSKWATIKRAKGATDAARGKVFTKLGKEIFVAVKLGGPNPDANSRLKLVMAKARAANMPNDNIQRSIKNAVNSADKANYESITYEGYGPNGVAVMVQCLTDNKNRTAGDVRHAFEKSGGSLGVSGSVAYIFDMLTEDGETIIIPSFTVTITPEKEAAFERLLDMLDENEDVQEVFHNAE